MPEAVEVCKMQLTLASMIVGTASPRACQQSECQQDAVKRSLQWNIHVGNALTDETWKNAFPGHSDGFNVIIGNPPYVEYSKVVYPMTIGINNKIYGNLYAEIVEQSL